MNPFYLRRIPFSDGSVLWEVHGHNSDSQRIASSTDQVRTALFVADLNTVVAKWLAESNDNTIDCGG